MRSHEMALTDFSNYTPDFLNGLSVAERQAMNRGPFGRALHDSGCEHVAWIRWSGRKRKNYAPTEHQNGSMFFLDCGSGPFAVTAAHVYDAFLDFERTHKVFDCALGKYSFDLKKRLIADGRHQRIDIATFKISLEEVAMLGKSIVTADARTWPAAPEPGQGIFFGGFPECERYVVGRHELECGLHSGMTPVTDSTDYHIRCKFDRSSWVDVRGQGFPPEDYNFSGVSGGPMLVPEYRGGRWGWRLAGVLYEAVMSGPFEVLNAVRAHHILPDGRLIN